MGPSKQYGVSYPLCKLRHAERAYYYALSVQLRKSYRKHNGQLAQGQFQNPIALRFSVHHIELIRKEVYYFWMSILRVAEYSPALMS